MSLTKANFRMMDGQVANVIDFGAKGDGVTDDSAAIQATVDALDNLTGGTVFFPPGQFVINNEVLITHDNIQLEGSGGLGHDPVVNPTLNAGSYITYTADVTGSLIKFAAPVAKTASNGCAVRNLDFIHYDRANTCDAALEIEASDSFTINKCRMSGIKGSGIKFGRSVQSYFADISLNQCGDVGKPALWLSNTTVSQGVQNSTFTGLRVEVCMDESFIKIEAENLANRWYSLGFETRVIGVENTDGIYIDCNSEDNSFIGGSVYTQAAGGTNPKISISKSRCIVSNFHSVGTCTGPVFLLNGANYCSINNIIVNGVDDATASQYVVDANASIHLSINGINGNFISGVNFDSDSTYCAVSNITLREGAEKGIRNGGDRNTFSNCIFARFTTSVGGVIENSSTASFNRMVNCAVDQATTALSGYEDLGADNHFSAGFIYNISIGDGIRLNPANRASVLGNQLYLIGRHGIHALDSLFDRIDNNDIRFYSAQTVSTFSGIFLDDTLAANKTWGFTVCGNKFEKDGGTPLADITVDDNVGVERYQYGIFTHNNARNGLKGSIIPNGGGTGVIADNIDIS